MNNKKILARSVENNTIWLALLLKHIDSKKMATALQRSRRELFDQNMYINKSCCTLLPGVLVWFPIIAGFNGYTSDATVTSTHHEIPMEETGEKNNNQMTIKPVEFHSIPVDLQAIK